MNKAFENILDRLEELQNYACFPTEFVDEEQSKIHSYYANKLTEILKLTEQYNNGWIPCSERLPSGLDFVLYTHKDGEVDICSIEYFYDYLDKFTAWQPLPEPFKERD